MKEATITISTTEFDPLDYDATESIHGLIFIFKICGLWPAKCKFRNVYLIYGTIFQFTFTFAYCSFQLLSFYFKTNMDQITVVVFECLAEISLWVRVINFVTYFDSIHNCLAVIKSFKMVTKQEILFCKKRFRMFSKIMRFYLGCASFACLFSLSAPLFSETTMLAYPAWYPLDWQHNPIHYWIAYCYQFVGMLILAHSLVLLEVYHIYLMIAIGVQIDILSQRLRNIGRGDLALTKEVRDKKILAFFVENIKTFEVISSNFSSFAIVTCIARLIQIERQESVFSKLIDQVEELFNIQFFYQFICSAIIFCVTAFKIMTMNIAEEMFSLAFYLSFSATMMNEIFLPCYFGNEVTLKREQLAFAIYSSDWFELSQPFKKNMILFLEGLKRVRILKSGKIFTLSLFSFLTVINRSYSCFAVLRTFIK